MIAHEVNALLADGWDWNDACRHVAKQHEISLTEVVKMFRQEFGKHPQDV